MPRRMQLHFLSLTFLLTVSIATIVAGALPAYADQQDEEMQDPTAPVLVAEGDDDKLPDTCSQVDEAALPVQGAASDMGGGADASPVDSDSNLAVCIDEVVGDETPGETCRGVTGSAEGEQTTGLGEAPEAVDLLSASETQDDDTLDGTGQASDTSNQNGAAAGQAIGAPADTSVQDDMAKTGEGGQDPQEDETEPLWHGLYERVTDTCELAGAFVMRLDQGELAFDPKGGSTAARTAVQAYTANDTVNQRFSFVQNADGSYCITGIKSGLYLSPAGNVVKAGTAVVLDKLSDVSRQSWLLSCDEESGLILIRNAANEALAICLASGLRKGSALVLGGELDGYVAQVALYRAVPTSSNGSYVISSRADARFVVDCAGGTTAKGSSVQLWTANSSAAQHMRLTWDAKTGYYRIDCGRSGLVLDCQGGKVTNGTNVQLWTNNGTIAQRWSLALKEDGTYDIRSAKSGLQLGATGNAIGVKGNIAIYTPTTSNNRLWRLTSDTAAAITSDTDAQLQRETKAYTLWNGIYLPVLSVNGSLGPVVICLATTNLVFDPQGGKTVAGTRLQFYTGNDTVNQRFAFSRNRDGSYRIMGLKSSLYLTLAKGAIKEGLLVAMEKSSSSIRQNWLLSYDEANNLMRILCAADERFALTTTKNAQGGKLVLGKASTASRFELYRPVATIPDGTYLIENRSNETLVIDSVGSKANKAADVRLGTSTNALTQQLRFEWDARTGYYRIYSSTSRFLLDCKSGGIKAGTNVQLWNNNGTVAQLWSLREMAGNSGYEIRSAKSGLQVGAVGNDIRKDGSIGIYNPSISSKRAWYLRRTAEGSSDSATSQKLAIPTDWYGRGEDYQAYHPKVIAFDEAWNGYRYWMAYTPYPNRHSSFEDPCIAASNDLWNWEVPEGLSNPIDDLHEDGTSLIYNSDTHMLFNADTQQLELYWRTVYYDDVIIYRSTSSDGVAWSDKEEVMHRVGVAVDDVLSPVVMYEEGVWRMWYVVDNWGTVRYTESSDGRTWDEASTLVIPYANTGMYTWHLDVAKTDRGYEALLSAHMQKNNLKTMSVWSSTSKDGITGWSTPTTVLEPTSGTMNWDNLGLYRSSLLYLGGSYFVFYSGHNTRNYCGVGLAKGTDLTALERVTDAAMALVA